MSFNLKKIKTADILEEKMVEDNLNNPDPNANPQLDMLTDISIVKTVDQDLLNNSPDIIKEKAEIAFTPDGMENKRNDIIEIIKQREQTQKANQNSQRMIFPQNNRAASNKGFNLKKAQAQQINLPSDPPFDPMGMNDSPELRGDQLDEMNNINQSLHFDKFADFENWVESKKMELGNNEAIIVDEFTDSINDALELYFSEEPEMNEERLAQIYFSDEFKQYREKDIEIPGIHKTISESLNEIKKLAKLHAKKSGNIKTAQHKDLNNVIMWGPSPKPRIDPFYRQPVSDWHIMERNKGFGLVVDDVWNIDYESIWRANIMDKYSRAYRDKDGKWVGGYLNKRFEIDYNVPVGNDYQLKPGQLRKPVLAEYGNLESRLQNARNKGEVEGGPVVNKDKPTDWSNPKMWGKKAFNLKTASSKKKS